MALRVTCILRAARSHPAPPRALQQPTKTSTTTILEVERKFRRLTVPTLSNMHLVSQQPHHDHPELLLPTQRPPSASVQPLPARTIHDIYYDTPDHSLCRTGAWIRLRNGEWQAKVRRGAWGGDFGNSRFEALRGEEAVGRCIQDIVGNYTIGGKGGTGNFGLAKLAEFVTEREAWMVDREFKVVRGRMVFGHEVGEVELQVEVAEDTGEVREGGADGGDG